MIKRFLANLTRAFQIEENSANNELMIELFKDLDSQFLRKKMRELTPEDIISDIKTRFQSGQVIRHKRYGYRGVIVSSDAYCQATDSWYYGNQTQPDPQQPWYHVLMHGADQVTYVAQINLMQDDSNEKVDHPLLSYFFTQTADGKYIRNDNEWPDTDF